jgi:hypothetical protein
LLDEPVSADTAPGPRAPHRHAAAKRSPPVVVTGVSYMSDLGFIVLVIVVFALIGLVAKGVNRL